MKLIVAGSSGLVGQAFVRQALQDGHVVVSLRRPETGGALAGALLGLPALAGRLEQASWQPERGVCDPRILEGADAVLNFCGSNIGERRWTEARKRDLRESRIRTTRCLVGALERCARRPGLYLGASAIGYYGDRGEEVLAETARPGRGFLPQLCVDWEAESQRLEAISLRVVHARLGLVLAREGGALKRLLPLYKACLGGPLGDGRAWMSWISLEDLVAALFHCVRETTLSGPVNCVSPQPLRNAAFARVVGKALHRPARLPTPGWALRLALGEMAGPLLLASTCVEPGVLKEGGFVWRSPGLAGALGRLGLA